MQIPGSNEESKQGLAESIRILPSGNGISQRFTKESGEMGTEIIFFKRVTEGVERPVIEVHEGSVVRIPGLSEEVAFAVAARTQIDHPLAVELFNNVSTRIRTAVQTLGSIPLQTPAIPGFDPKNEPLSQQVLI